MRDIQGTADDLREAAHNLGKRASSRALYGLLGECMALAERLNSDPGERAGLLERFRGQNTEGRRYIESNTDNHMLVCRYVFDAPGGPNTQRNSAWRYGVALSVAAAMGVKATDMAHTLATCGGIDTFFQRRKQPRKLLRAKVLRLTRQIEIPSDREFTLTLRRLPENVFEVEVVNATGAAP